MKKKRYTTNSKTFVVLKFFMNYISIHSQYTKEKKRKALEYTYNHHLEDQYRKLVHKNISNKLFKLS